MKENSTGTFLFPKVSQLALWDGEVTGQLSDGTWENTRPHDHWQFWCRLDARHDAGLPAPVITPSGYVPYNQKTRYNLMGLVNMRWGNGDSESGYILRDRMLAMGRLGACCQKLGIAWQHGFRSAAEYMQELVLRDRTRVGAYEAFVARCEGREKWHHEYVGKYMEGITGELARCFYAVKEFVVLPEGVSYELKDLKEDVVAIKDAMVRLSR